MGWDGKNQKIEKFRIKKGLNKYKHRTEIDEIDRGKKF